MAGKAHNVTNITAGTRAPGQAFASESALYVIHSLGFVSMSCHVLYNSKGGGGGARGIRVCTGRRNGDSNIYDFLLKTFSVVPLEWNGGRKVHEVQVQFLVTRHCGRRQPGGGGGDVWHQKFLIRLAEVSGVAGMPVERSLCSW